MNSKNQVKNIYIAIIVASIIIVGIPSCNQASLDKKDKGVDKSATAISITENEVLNAQKAWSDGIVNIGKVYLAKGDYKTTALNHINQFYAYDQGPVLFKPTLASQKQFRTNIEGALSYFVSGNNNYPEDHGFALKPWCSVRWENMGTKIIGNMAVAMGNYYFTPCNGGREIKVEYTFAYTKDINGKLKILLHDSHLPYTPPENH